MKYCAECREPITRRGFCPYHPEAGAAPEQEKKPPQPRSTRARKD